ncbi:hypothetical protein AB0C02_31780 [Micromonospora sp. NPDC048999]|uniref:hypothetical protein n=1 Tax=Micromonospora sp. NPDC048999 TaxID=3155391 RepID=UPI0033E07507
MLVLLVAGCAEQALPAQKGSTTQAIATQDEQVLRRWSQWNTSALPGTAYPELPHRDSCGPDPNSDLWFLDAQRVPGRDERWTCTLPAGRSLVVVPTGVVSPDQSICREGLNRLDSPLSAEGEAYVDGEPVVLQMGEPLQIAAADPVAAVAPQMYFCALWGIAGPLGAGRHTIILRNTVAEKTGTATVDVTVQ